MTTEFNLSEKEYHLETCDEDFENCCVKQDDKYLAILDNESLVGLCSECRTTKELKQEGYQDKTFKDLQKEGVF